MTDYRHKGVALIQVLIMTAIMSLIAIQFSLTARHQVDTAQSFNDRVMAELALKSAQSQILFNFFKHDPENLSDQVVNGVKWNLRGQAFTLVEGVSVNIQSASGLMSTLTMPEEYWLKVLASLGIDDEKAYELVHSLMDWHDIDNIQSLYGAEQNYYQNESLPLPRNGPMQHISELQYVKGMTAALYTQLSPMATIYPSGSFNPSLAPASLVNAIFDEDTAKQIIEAQQSGSFTEQKWYDIVGSRHYDFVDIHPRNTFLISITAKFNDVVLTRRFDIKVENQKSVNPIVILANY